MHMLSFEFFCHKKEEPNNVIALLARQVGFVRLPEEYESMFEDGEKVYEGLASINGKNLLDPSLDPLIKENIDGCLITSPFIEKKIAADNALLSNLLDAYSKERELSVSDKTFLQKVCLSLNEKLCQNNGYVYVNLRECENAPLVLDVLKSLFDGFDILLTLPKNLQFAVPILKTVKPRVVEKKEDGSLCLEEGYQAFFDDVCGIASPNFENIPRVKQKKANGPIESETEPRSLRYQIQPIKKSEFLSPGSRIDKSVKKDLGGNVLFSLIFVTFSIAAPYFYFGFQNQSTRVFFAIYLILDVFFLVMCSIALSYLAEGKSKVTKGYFYLGILLSPVIEIIASIAFIFVAKSLSWLSVEAYVFFGLGLGYILIHPLVIWAHKQYRLAKKKAKAKK